VEKYVNFSWRKVKWKIAKYEGGSTFIVPNVEECGLTNKKPFINELSLIDRTGCEICLVALLAFKNYPTVHSGLFICQNIEIIRKSLWSQPARVGFNRTIFARKIFVQVSEQPTKGSPDMTASIQGVPKITKAFNILVGNISVQMLFLSNVKIRMGEILPVA
jgi:hypothetical protein